MKKTMTIFIFLILAATMIFLLFVTIDRAMEIDSLKNQIKLQRREMVFLQNIANGVFSSCAATVSKFESVVRENGRDLLWKEDDALVGPFRVKKKNSCIVSIEVVNGF